MSNPHNGENLTRLCFEFGDVAIARLDEMKRLMGVDEHADVLREALNEYDRRHFKHPSVWRRLMRAVKRGKRV